MLLDRRRLVLGGAVAVAVCAAHAQVPGRMVRIGYLGYTANDNAEGVRIWRAFVERLRELGFAEGGNLVIEQRFAEGDIQCFAEFAAEMVRLQADVVVVSSGAAARAVMAASSSMPIVTTAVPDPVRAGLVASLARPGGQLTGISNLADELVPKRLELLKAALPQARLIAIARCPRCNAAAGSSAAVIGALRAEHEAAARSLGVRLLLLDVDAATDFSAATAALRRERPDALLLGATPVNVALRDAWLAFATEQRLPVLAPYRAGTPLSYGPDLRAIYRRVAEYVVKIINGARPGELPMEQPTSFEFVVDLKAAKAISLTIPQALLLRADQVLE